MKVNSEKFEKYVYKIHELIERSGSLVTWNDHLQDPDNPDQARQIDITIKRENILTLIECRIHKKPQDVTWIEELIGRRKSLQADVIIAVSASGFSIGAIKKAESYGIILRDFQSLTEQEVQEWGYKTHVMITFLQYKDVFLDFGLIPKYQNILYPEIFKKEAMSNSNLIYLLFQEVAFKIDDIQNNKTWKSGKINMKFTYPEELIIAGFAVKEVIFSAHVTKIDQELNIPAVFVYGDPQNNGLSREVFFEKMELGDSEIIQSKDIVSISLDFSSIKPPPNCQFLNITYDFNRLVTMPACHHLGLQIPSINLEQLNFLAHYFQ